MKKALSVTIVSALLLACWLPTFAQKQARTVNSKRPAPSSAPSETRFASVAAYSDGIRGVWLRWEMVAEVGNIGFQVYRVSKRGTELLSPERLVAGAAMRSSGQPELGETYEYLDHRGTLNDAYYVEALGLSGARTFTGQVYPQYVSDVASAAGLSADEVDRRSRP